MLRKLSLFVLVSFVSTAAYASQATALRQAMARHDDAVNVREHKLYGATLEKTDTSSYKFKYALVDLNGDGIKDAVVYLTGSDWCGSGGCTMRVMKGTKSGFVYQSGTLRVFTPIKVLKSKSHGWKSLAIGLRSGGLAVLSFNGKRYPLAPPDNPSSNSELRGAEKLVLHQVE